MTNYVKATGAIYFTKGYLQFKPSFKLKQVFLLEKPCLKSIKQFDLCWPWTKKYLSTMFLGHSFFHTCDITQSFQIFICLDLFLFCLDNTLHQWKPNRHHVLTRQLQWNFLNLVHSTFTDLLGYNPLPSPPPSNSTCSKQMQGSDLCDIQVLNFSLKHDSDSSSLKFNTTELFSLKSSYSDLHRRLISLKASHVLNGIGSLLQFQLKRQSMLKAYLQKQMQRLGMRNDTLVERILVTQWDGTTGCARSSSRE